MCSLSWGNYTAPHSVIRRPLSSAKKTSFQRTLIFSPPAYSSLLVAHADSANAYLTSKNVILMMVGGAFFFFFLQVVVMETAAAAA